MWTNSTIFKEFRLKAISDTLQFPVFTFGLILVVMLFLSAFSSPYPGKGEIKVTRDLDVVQLAAPGACDFYEGDSLVLQVTGGQIGNVDYQSYFLLCGQDGEIQRIQSNPLRTFTELPVGSFLVATLTVQLGTNFDGLRNGNYLADITGECVEVYQHFTFEVCVRPDEICGNGIDDDFDGFTDEQDVDCPCTIDSCPLQEGDSLSLFLAGGKIADPEYETYFLLTDTAGIIENIIQYPQTVFYDLPLGDFYVYSLNRKIGTYLYGLNIGDPFFDINGECINWWGRFCTRVIPKISPGALIGNEEICFGGGEVEITSVEDPLIPDEDGAYIFWQQQVLITDSTWSDWAVIPGETGFDLELPTLTQTTKFRRGVYYPRCDLQMFAETILKVVYNEMALPDLVMDACPGIEFEGDLRVQFGVNQFDYTLLSGNETNVGEITLQNTGEFYYDPITTLCQQETYVIQAADMYSSCLDTLTLTFTTVDTTAPIILSQVEDFEVTCDEVLPPHVIINAVDECPGISIDIEEYTGKGYGDSCSLGEYQILRVWQVEDLCGNVASLSQTIEVYDPEAPEIFKVHQDTSGRKVVGGQSNQVSGRWRYVKFPVSFDTIPYVFAQVNYDEIGTLAVAQVKNVTNAGFYMRVRMEEVQPVIGGRWDVDWMAFDRTIGFENLVAHDRGIINHTGRSYSNPQLNGNYGEAHIVGLQTTNEEDPATLFFARPTIDEVSVSLQEEISLNVETYHSFEKLASITMLEGTVKDVNETVFGEVFSVYVDTNWQLLPLNVDYINPIVIGSIEKTNNAVPVGLQVRKTAPDSVYVRINTFGYYNTAVLPEIAHYFIIEGSVPLDLCEGNALFGEDYFVLDNCSPFVEFSRIDNSVPPDKSEVLWMAKDDCSNEVIYDIRQKCDYVKLKLQAFLDGPLIGSGSNKLMRDDLRTAGLIPLEEPYTDLPNFSHLGNGGKETMKDSLLLIEGEKAIVDWVFVELKNPFDNEEVLFTRSAIICRDGSVMDIDGDSLVHFNSTPLGKYFVSLRHRNHLGVQTRIPIQMKSPFTDVNFCHEELLGHNAFKDNPEVAQTLWAGNLKPDDRVLYQGPINDVAELFYQVMSSEANTESIPNFILFDYKTGDFNMDGKVIFQGPNNDRAGVLFHSILKHPDNVFGLSNFMILDGIP